MKRGALTLFSNSWAMVPGSTTSISAVISKLSLTAATSSATAR